MAGYHIAYLRQAHVAPLREKTNDKRGETNDKRGETNDKGGETNDKRGENAVGMR